MSSGFPKHADSTFPDISEYFSKFQLQQVLSLQVHVIVQAASYLLLTAHNRVQTQGSPYNKTNDYALISQIYFWNRNLHLSDSYYFHYQESSTVYTAIDIYHTVLDS